MHNPPLPSVRVCAGLGFAATAVTRLLAAPTQAADLDAMPCRSNVDAAQILVAFQDSADYKAWEERVHSNEMPAEEAKPKRRGLGGTLGGGRSKKRDETRYMQRLKPPDSSQTAEAWYKRFEEAAQHLSANRHAQACAVYRDMASRIDRDRSHAGG